MADDISTMAGGQRIVDTALAEYGRLDGVVCVAGILRERMLFNMSEEEWDPVLATHLKGTFTVFRAASAVMRKQEGGDADRLHQRQPPGERVPGQLQRGEGRDHLTGPQRGARPAPVRGDGQRDIALYVDREGRLLLDELVTETYPVEDFAKAADDAHHGRVARGVLVF
ncbi:hypothetical protein SMICM304S_12098 [Streptomyces microflavus]